MIEEMLRHLVLGWSGFMALLVKASHEGASLPDETLTKLIECRARMEEAIALQLAMREKKRGAKK